MSQLEMPDIQRHNERELRRLEKGDMVEFKRGLYSHWAVYIGEENVVHLAGDERDRVSNNDSINVFTISGLLYRKAFVRVANFLEVAGENLALRNNDKDKKLNPLPPHEIVQNALSKRGEIGYSLIFQNCEHFASWCRYGEGKSDQVENIFTGLAVATAAVATAGLLYGMTRESKKEKNTSDED